jgi:hypothetical protein
MKEALLVILGFALALIPRWLDRKRRLKAHLQAIREEMQLTEARATMLLNHGIMAPLYRLPVSAYETSFPVLLAEGVLSEGDAFALGDYFCQVQDINRGLDNATAAAHANNDHTLKKEYGRLLLKAQRLMMDGHEGKAMYAAGFAVVERQLSQKWWRY